MKEWESITPDENLSEEPDKIEDIDPADSDQLILPEEAAL